MDKVSYDVDVIILSWNRVQETISAIDSAVAQKDVTLLVHVIDQGSSPDQLTILREHIAGLANVSLAELKHNIGVPGGRNYASSLGTAPIIVALDNDAIFSDEDTVARIVRRMSNERRLGAIGFRVLNYFTGKDDQTSWGYSERDWERRDKEFPASNFVGTGYAVRRDAFVAAGQYEDRLFFAFEELDLGLKLLNLGYEIRYVGSICVRHKVAPEAKVCWKNGRYFYTVRNRIYLSLKYRLGNRRLLHLAGGYFIRALPKGLLWDCIRGYFAAVAMYLTMPRDKESRTLRKLKPEIYDYLDMVYHYNSYTFWDRLGNAWRQGKAL